jgi:molybdopterin-containing oxidoreductase family membrane subunit
VSFNLACILIVVGVWLEKGLGFIVPGFIPTPLGEIWEYWPTMPEILISVGVWGAGLLFYTLALKIVIPIETGEMRVLSEDIAELLPVCPQPNLFDEKGLANKI